MNTKSNSWDHLPNAKHIGRILTSYHQHRDIWLFVFHKWNNLVGTELRYQAWDEARTKCKELSRLDIWHESSIPSIYAVIALIAYDDCAHYLDMPSQELTTIALLGVTPAILLLEAVIAFEEIANINRLNV